MKYAGIKVEITTHNRDRKGGHQFKTFFGHLDSNKNGGADRKRIDKKRARKEHKRILTEQLHLAELDGAMDRYERQLAQNEAELADFEDYMSMFSQDELYNWDHPEDWDQTYKDNYYVDNYLSKEGLTRMDQCAKITEGN